MLGTEFSNFYRKFLFLNLLQPFTGVKLNEKEKRLAKVMVTTKSNLARNMAAEFMKTRGDYENMKKEEEVKNEAKVAKIEDNINRASREEIQTRRQFQLKSTEVSEYFFLRTQQGRSRARTWVRASLRSPRKLGEALSYIVFSRMTMRSSTEIQEVT